MRKQRQGVSEAVSHTQHQPEIQARPVEFNSIQQQYKHFTKPMPQPCLRGDVKREVCAHVSWGCRFHLRDCLLASGLCTAPGIMCPQPNQHMLCGKYTTERALPSKIKPNQENQELGKQGAPAKGWDSSRQWDHHQVCSQFSLHYLGKAGSCHGRETPAQETTMTIAMAGPPLGDTQVLPKHRAGRESLCKHSHRVGNLVLLVFL